MNTIYIGEDSFIKNIDHPHRGIVDFLFTSTSKYNIVKEDPITLVNKGVKFLYIYPILDIFFFNKEEFPSPPQEILNLIKANKCKLVFIYPQEGNLFSKDSLNFLVEFIKRNNLSAENTFLFNSNLLLKQQYQKFNFDSKLLSIEEMNYFEFNPWFINYYEEGVKIDSQILKKRYIENFRTNKTKFKEFYFNSLNRLPRGHRVFLFALMYENFNVRKNSLMSLGPLSLWPPDPNNPDNVVNVESFKHLFYNHDLLSKYESFLVDRRREWEENGLQVDGSVIPNQAGNFNYDIYNNSHISIITETEVEDGILFFSEKIFKPIVAGHPFILFGGKGSLKKLKELGYKTFDKWWDESYDDIQNWQERAIEISKLISNLSSLSPRSLELLVDDMSETLEHNINTFFKSFREYSFFNRLYEIQGSNETN